MEWKMRNNNADIQTVIDFVGPGGEERDRVYFDHFSNPAFRFTKHSSTFCICISPRHPCLLQINHPLC